MEERVRLATDIVGDEYDTLEEVIAALELICIILP